MEDDDYDIYGDLEEFDYKTKYEEAEAIIEDLQNKLGAALHRINTLEVENVQLQSRYDNLEKSFQSLLLTARAEVKRKDAQIVAARNERDDFVFRRKNVGPNRRHEDYRTQSTGENFNENLSHLKSNSDSDNVKPFHSQDPRSQSRNPFQDPRNQNRNTDRDQRNQGRVAVQDHANQSKQSMRNNDKEYMAKFEKINCTSRSECRQLDQIKSTVIQNSGNLALMKEQDTGKVKDHKTVLMRNDSSEKEEYVSRAKQQKERNESKETCRGTGEQSQHTFINLVTSKRIPPETNSIEEEKHKKSRLSPLKNEVSLEQPRLNAAEINEMKSSHGQDSTEQEHCMGNESSINSKVDDNNVKTNIDKPPKSVTKFSNDINNFNEQLDKQAYREEFRRNTETNKDYDNLKVPSNEKCNEKRSELDKKQSEESNTRKDNHFSAEFDRDNLKDREHFKRIEKRSEESRNHRKEHRSKERDKEDHHVKHGSKVDHIHDKKSTRDEDYKTSNKRDISRKRPQNEHDESYKRHKHHREDRHRSRNHRDSDEEIERRYNRDRDYRRSHRDREKEKHSRYEKYDRGRDRGRDRDRGHDRDRKGENKSRSKSKSDRKERSNKVVRSKYDSTERKSREDDQHACNDCKDRHSSRERRSKEKDESNLNKKSENVRKDHIDNKHHEKQTKSELIEKNIDIQENDHLKATKRAREEENFERDSKRIKPNDKAKNSQDIIIQLSEPKNVVLFDSIDTLSKGSKTIKLNKTLEKDAKKIGIQKQESEKAETFERIDSLTKDPNLVKVTERVDEDANKIIIETTETEEVENFANIDVSSRDTNSVKVIERVEKYSKEIVFQKPETKTIENIDMLNKHSERLTRNESKDNEAKEAIFQNPEIDKIENFESIETSIKGLKRVNYNESVLHISKEIVIQKLKSETNKEIVIQKSETKIIENKDSEKVKLIESKAKKTIIQKPDRAKSENMESIDTPSNDSKGVKLAKSLEKDAKGIDRQKPELKKVHSFESIDKSGENPDEAKVTERVDNDVNKIVIEKSESTRFESIDILNKDSKIVALNESGDKKAKVAIIQKPETDKVENFETIEMSSKDLKISKHNESVLQNSKEIVIQKSETKTIEDKDSKKVKHNDSKAKKTIIQKPGREKFENIESIDTPRKDSKRVTLHKSPEKGTREIGIQKPETEEVDNFKDSNRVKHTERVETYSKEIVTQKSETETIENFNALNKDSKRVDLNENGDNEAKKSIIQRPETKNIENFENIVILSNDLKRVPLIEKVGHNTKDIVVQKPEKDAKKIVIQKPKIETEKDKDILNQKSETKTIEHFDRLSKDSKSVQLTQSLKEDPKEIGIEKSDSEIVANFESIDKSINLENSDTSRKDSNTVKLTKKDENDAKEIRIQKSETKKVEELDTLHKDLKKVTLNKSRDKEAEKTIIQKLRTESIENIKSTDTSSKDLKSVAEKVEQTVIQKSETDKDTVNTNPKIVKLTSRVLNDDKEIVIEKPDTEKQGLENEDKEICIHKSESGNVKNFESIDMSSKDLEMLKHTENVDQNTKETANEKPEMEVKLSKNSKCVELPEKVERNPQEINIQKTETKIIENINSLNTRILLSESEDKEVEKTIIQKQESKKIETLESIETSSKDRVKHTEKIEQNAKDIAIQKPESPKEAKKIVIQKPETEKVEKMLQKDFKRAKLNPDSLAIVNEKPETEKVEDFDMLTGQHNVSVEKVDKEIVIQQPEMKKCENFETLGKDSNKIKTNHSSKKDAKKIVHDRQEIEKKKSLSKKSKRKKKDAKEIAIQKPETEKIENVVIKRKPGRPKKIKIDTPIVPKRKPGRPKNSERIAKQQETIEKKSDNVDSIDMLANKGCESDVEENVPQNPENFHSFDMSHEDYVAAMRLQLELEMYNSYSNEVNYYEDPSISMRPTFVYQVMEESQVDVLEHEVTTMEKECLKCDSESCQHSGHQSQDNLTCELREQIIDTRDKTCSSNETSINNASKQESALNTSTEYNQMEIDPLILKNQKSTTKESEIIDMDQPANEDKISSTPKQAQETTNDTTAFQQNLNSIGSIESNSFHSKIGSTGSKSDDTANIELDNIDIRINPLVKNQSPKRIDSIANLKVTSDVPSNVVENEQIGGNINLVNEDAKLQSSEHPLYNHYENVEQTEMVTLTTTETSLQTVEIPNHELNCNMSIISPVGNRFESSQINSDVFQRDEEIFETPIKAPLQIIPDYTPSVQFEIKLMRLKRLVRKRRPSVDKKLLFATKKKYEQDKIESNTMVSNNCDTRVLEETEEGSANIYIPSKTDYEKDDFDELAREIFGDDIWDSAIKDSKENNAQNQSIHLSTDSICVNQDSAEARPIQKKKVNNRTQKVTKRVEKAKAKSDIHKTDCYDHDKRLFNTHGTENETPEKLKSIEISKQPTGELDDVESMKTDILSHSTDAFIAAKKLKSPGISKHLAEELNDAESMDRNNVNIETDKLSDSTNAIVAAKTIKSSEISKQPAEELHDAESTKISNENIEPVKRSDSVDAAVAVNNLKSPKISKQPAEELHDAESMKISNEDIEIDEGINAKENRDIHESYGNDHDKKQINARMTDSKTPEKLISPEISKQPAEVVESTDRSNENIEADKGIKAKGNSDIHESDDNDHDKKQINARMNDSKTPEKLKSPKISEQPAGKLHVVEPMGRSNENIEADKLSDSTEAIVAALSSTRTELTITLVTPSHLIEHQSTTPPKPDDGSNIVYIDLTTPPDHMEGKHTDTTELKIEDTNLEENVESELRGRTPTVQSTSSSANNPIILCNACNQTQILTAAADQNEDNINELLSNKPKKITEFVDNQAIPVTRKRKNECKLANKNSNKKNSKPSSVENKNQKLDNISTLDIRTDSTISTSDNSLQIKGSPINSQVKPSQVNRTNKVNNKPNDVKCTGKQSSKASSKSHGVKLIGHIIDGFEREPSPPASNQDSSRVLKNELFRDALGLKHSTPVKSNNVGKHRLSDTSSSDTSAEIKSIKCKTKMTTVKRSKQDIKSQSTLAIRLQSADSCPALPVNSQANSCAASKENSQAVYCKEPGINKCSTTNMNDVNSNEIVDSQVKILDLQTLNQGCALGDSKMPSGTDDTNCITSEVEESNRLEDHYPIKPSEPSMTIIPVAKKKPLKRLTQRMEEIAPKAINNNPNAMPTEKSAVTKERPSSPVNDYYSSNPINHHNSSESICDSSTPVTSTHSTPVKPNKANIEPKTSSLITKPVAENNLNVSGGKTVLQSIDVHQNDAANTHYEKRNISLASTNYLIEKVDSNVVNVFITRKRVKKKRKD